MKYFPFVFCFINVFTLFGQHQIKVLDSTAFTLNEGVVLHKTSFRGLSVVDDKIIWAGGSRGTIARSTNGGKTFTFTRIKGYEKSDFRDIEAFDANRAVIMSSGTPSYMLKTTDGGISWKEVYRNDDKNYFLDAMDFWDKSNGLIVGDPINGHFVLLQTTDGGNTWKELDTTQTPKALPGEAVFAASGTSLRCLEKNEAGFVTGGKYSRIILMHNIPNMGVTEIFHLPVQKGNDSQGAFSFCTGFNPKHKFVVVGGNYAADTLVYRNSSWHTNESFHAVTREFDVKGYRECVERLDNEKLVACGTSGVDVWQKENWTNISKEGFHTVRKAKKGKAVFLVGGKGKIGLLIADR